MRRYRGRDQDEIPQLQNSLRVCIHPLRILRLCLFLVPPLFLALAAAAAPPAASTIPAVTIPAGPFPGAAAPVAVALDPSLGKLFVAHCSLYGDLAVNAALPTNVVSVVDRNSGRIMATIPVGTTLNGNDQGLAVDAARHRVFVTNFDDGTLSVIDGTSATLLRTITVSAQPLRVAADTTLGLIYIAHSTGMLSILDADTLVSKGTVDMGGGVYDVAVDPATHRVYTAVRAFPWTLKALNPQTRAITASLPLNFLLDIKGLAIDPGAFAYLADYDSGKVVAVDIHDANPVELRRFTGGLYPNDLAVNASTHLLHVLDSGNQCVNVFNSDGQKQGSAPVLRLPVALTIDAAHQKAYVADAGSDSLSVVALDSNQTCAQFVLGTLDFGLAYDPSAGRLYAANYAAETISVINPATHAVIDQFHAGPGPWALAIDPALNQLYSLNLMSSQGDLAVLDALSGQLKAQIPVGKAQAGRVAVNPATHRVYVTGGSNSANRLYVIDGTASTLVTSVTVGTNPVGIAIDPVAHRVFVANNQGGTISVINTDNNQLAATWTPPQNNVWALAIDPVLHHLYVSVPLNTVGSFNGLEVLDSQTGAFLGQIPLGGSTSVEEKAGIIAVEPTTHRIFFTDSGGQTLSVLEGRTFKILGIVNATHPHDVAIDEKGRAWVANWADGTATLFDTAMLRAAVSPGWQQYP